MKQSTPPKTRTVWWIASSTDSPPVTLIGKPIARSFPPRPGHHLDGVGVHRLRRSRTIQVIADREHAQSLDQHDVRLGLCLSAVLLDRLPQLLHRVLARRLDPQRERLAIHDLIRRQRS